MCMQQPKPPKPPPPPAPPPPVLEQGAPVMDDGLGIENGVRKKAQGTKKYSTSGSSVGLGIPSVKPSSGIAT